MIRRQARERRDYLYRRALLLRDASIAEKRAKLKASLASGKPLDPSIANDKSLRQDFKYDESLQTDSKASASNAKDADQVDIDDEYAVTSGLVDPRPLVTTSRSPSSRLSTFAKEIRLLLPTSIRLNREVRRQRLQYHIFLTVLPRVFPSTMSFCEPIFQMLLVVRCRRATHI
ncbi:U3 small nucleolar ribonucleoprotein IMP4 [Coccidioides immitis H538.4]|uniref:U3 small nucleolar ribonucleoprotein protein IMP4 n=1 Tax=Coccidioides immitis H538.4 TaxID=396776 RepID=A0A0J8RM16_COCIT|nr:U3 small nucleolar ribonucleoprotein IMP4 [Coccidioides immitis H538.4]